MIKIMILVRMEYVSSSKKHSNKNIGKMTSMKIKFEVRKSRRLIIETKGFSRIHLAEKVLQIHPQ